MLEQPAGGDPGRVIVVVSRHCQTGNRRTADADDCRRPFHFFRKTKGRCVAQKITWSGFRSVRNSAARAVSTSSAWRKRCARPIQRRLNQPASRLVNQSRTVHRGSRAVM